MGNRRVAGRGSWWLVEGQGPSFVTSRKRCAMDSVTMVVVMESNLRVQKFFPGAAMIRDKRGASLLVTPRCASPQSKHRSGMSPNLVLYAMVGLLCNLLL